MVPHLGAILPSRAIKTYMNKKSLIYLFLLFFSIARTQTTYTFLTCGATGTAGPNSTQVNNTYTNTTLSGGVSVVNGIQSWTVPTTGPYRIDAYGAQGGNNASGLVGGLGARSGGVFTLTAGQVIQILVGQWPGANDVGGGGGTFVMQTPYNNLASVLTIAGGGGGAAGPCCGSQVGGVPGNASTSGAAPSNAGCTSGSVGVNGTGGGGGNVSTYGSGGGGGLLTDGGNGQTNAFGGKAFVNGGYGGVGNKQAGYSFGGFGGGGGPGNTGGWITGSGGGGGGYSGGAGNCGSSKWGEGGGGGSYNAGTSQTLTTGANAGDGRVVITRLYFANIAQTASITCNSFSNAALSTTVNGGLAPYTYTWLPSGTNASTLANLGAGVYTLIAKDANNLLTSNTFTITQPSAISTAISQTNAVCYGQNSGVARVTATGGTGAYTYSWTGSSSTSSVASSIVAGNYSVTVKDANNCVTGTVVTITQPSSFAVTAGTSTTAVCAGNQVTLSGSGATSYTWTGGVTNASAFAPSATSGYTVTGFVGVCTNTAEVTVTVNPRPTISAANGTICVGQSFAITASGASTYTYQGGSSSVAPTSNAIYTVTGSSAVGCQAVNPATVNITVNPLPVVSITGTNAVCSGGSIVLTASGANTYTWTNTSANTTTISVSPTANTTYSLSGTSPLGCVGTTTTLAVAVYSLPLVSITGTNGVCIGSSIALTANGATTYTWTNPSSNNSTVSVAPTSNTTYSLTGRSSQGCTGTVATLAVSVYSLPTIAITGTNGVCNGSTITLSGAGASTYTWTNPSSNNTTVGVSPSSNTSYTLTGRSSQGCLGNTATYAVTVYSLPVIAISGTAAVCNGSSILLTGSGANSYTWAGVTSNSVSVLVAPTSNISYSLTGTSSQGCTGNTAVMAVAVYSVPVISITGTAAICTGNAATLTANGASTYTWLAPSANTGSVAVNPTTNTSYSLQGTSSQGCTGNTAVLAMTVHPLPVVGVSGNTFICIGDTSVFTASGASSYVWSSGQITSTAALAPTVTASYTIVGTDLNGCINNTVTSILVNNLPVISVTGNFTICAGDSTILTASGAASYTWGSSSNSNSIAITPTIASGYEVYLVAGTSTAGCNNLLVDSVLVNALPSLTITGGNMVCLGDTITLNAAGAATYSWDNGATTATVALTPSVNTSYTVIGTSAENCSISAVESITVVAYPTVTLSGNNTMCMGDSLTLSVSGADTYSWSTGSTNSLVVIHPSASGTVSVIGGVIPGCNDTAMVNITVNANPTVVPVAAASTICVGESIQLNATGAVNYTWSTGATTSSVVVSPTITTTYTVNGTDANGCKGDSTLLITLSDCAGIANTTLTNALAVYPNPNNGLFTVDASAVGTVEVTVFTLTGQLIETKIVTAKAEIDLSKYDNGLYLVRLTLSNGETISKHLIKQ